MTISSPSIGGTVSDGTVVWTVQQVASTKNLVGFVNDGISAVISGIRRKTSGSYLQIVGGTDISTCPYLELIGPLNTGISEGLRGRFSLVAQDSENTIGLSGNVNGTLAWNNNDLGGSAIIAKSLGATGYIKYASGLLLQWGDAGSVESVAEVGTCMYNIFPLSFITNYRIVACTQSTLSQILGDSTFSINYLPDISTLSKVYFKKADKLGNFSSSGGYLWFAIGY